MQKNKRWLVLPLLIILILPIICVPALAVGGDVQQFSPILWSFVITPTGIQEFAGNYLDVNSSGDIVVDFDGFGTQAVHYNQGAAEVVFYTDYNERYIALSAVGCVFDVDSIDTMNSVVFHTLSGDNQLMVTVDCTIYDYQLINNVWQPVELYCSFTDISGLVQFGSLLARELNRLTDKRMVLVKTLNVYVSVLGDEFYNDAIAIEYDTVANIPDLRNYVSQYELLYDAPDVIVDPANPNDVSFVDWLQVAVGGFLDFQLWPGFTLNQLIEFVVVIGLVLWFITLLI